MVVVSAVVAFFCLAAYFDTGDGWFVAGFFFWAALALVLSRELRD